MNAATHTPGPWTASAPDGDYHDVIRIYAAGRDDLPVAVCPQQQSAALSVLTGQTNETTEAAANARLIAAAPDLLAIARLYVSECTNCSGVRDVPCDYCEHIWAAIDRAEGRP